MLPLLTRKHHVHSHTGLVKRASGTLSCKLLLLMNVSVYLLTVTYTIWPKVSGHLEYLLSSGVSATPISKRIIKSSTHQTSKLPLEATPARALRWELPGMQLHASLTTP